MPSGMLLKAVQAQGEYTRLFAITPDPNTPPTIPLPMPTRAIRCVQAGSLVVNSVGGDESVTVNFLAGETREICVTQVLSASGITTIEGMA